MRYLRAALVLAALAVALLAPSVASAQINAVQIGPTATLGPEGATVIVPVTVNCDAGYQGSVYVRLRQAQGRRLIDGSGYAPVSCDGSTQTLTVIVWNESGIRFKQGSAAASGNLYVFDPTTGTSYYQDVAPQAIQIRKR